MNKVSESIEPEQQGCNDGYTFNWLDVTGLF